jgi:Na+/proline symporter
MIAVAFAFYIGAQLQGAGQALDGVFGVGLLPGVVIGAGVVLLYTWLGGFHAVALVDTLQGVAIAIAAVVLPTLAFLAAGGLSGIERALDTAPDTYLAPFGAATGWAAAGLVLGLFATGFGALGQPHLAAWIMAARDRSARLRGAAIATLWAVGVYGGMAVLGLSARAIFGADAPPEGVLFRLADDLLPPILAGLVTAAVLSAIMSTVDSQLLVASAAVARDLPARPVGPATGGEAGVGNLRLAMLVLCVLAVVVTLALPRSIFDRTLFAWTALGAGFGPVLVARAAGWRPSPTGVFAALLSSFLTSLAFEFLLPQGPGSVFARTAPWVAGFAGLAAGALLAGGRRRAKS